MAQRDGIQDIYPLSPLQEGILFHSVLAPAGGDYVVQMIGELAHRIQPRHLRQAWELIVERHDVLRTLFVWEGQERPLQIVVRHADLPWIELDWRALSSAQRKKE